MKAPVPAPVEWHPVTQKARDEAEDPKARLEAARMGAVLAAMRKKDNVSSKHVVDH
jgi:hypothetical protein